MPKSSNLRWRVSLPAAALLGLLLTGCPGGPSSASGCSTTGEHQLDDSAGAMAGFYTTTSVSHAETDCDSLSRIAAAKGIGIELSERRADGEAGGSQERLRIVVCASGKSCQGVEWKGMLAKSPELGWRSTTSEARAVESQSWVRRCELSWTETTVIPTETGIRIERKVHRDRQVLEGNMSCGPGLAEEFAEQLPCVQRDVLEARSGRTSSSKS